MENKNKKKQDSKSIAENITFRECTFPDQFRECCIVTSTKTVILRSTFMQEDMPYLVETAKKLLKEV